MPKRFKPGKKRVRFSIGAEEDHDGVEDESEVMEVEEQGDEEEEEGGGSEDEAEDIRQMVLQQNRKKKKSGGFQSMGEIGVILLALIMNKCFT